MSELKIINKKEIFVILKTWMGGKIELGDAYWEKDKAGLEALKLISDNASGPFISLHTINLHGCMVDKK